MGKRNLSNIQTKLNTELRELMEEAYILLHCQRVQFNYLYLQL